MHATTETEKVLPLKSERVRSVIYTGSCINAIVICWDSNIDHSSQIGFTVQLFYLHFLSVSPATRDE
jgi:hypothetical protein